MTVAEYFAAHRDEHGRAWLTQHYWIEYGVGCFRLNAPLEEIRLVGADDCSIAVSIAATAMVPPIEREEPQGESIMARVHQWLVVAGIVLSTSACAPRTARLYSTDTASPPIEMHYKGGKVWIGEQAAPACQGEYKSLLGSGTAVLACQPATRISVASSSKRRGPTGTGRRWAPRSGSARPSPGV
jgi:hypothetical protein